MSQEDLDKLVDLHRRYEASLEAAEALRIQRDRLVLKLTDDRHTRRQLADALGVTRGRVQQIVDRARGT